MKWHLHRAKVQWNFITKKSKCVVLWNLFWMVIWAGLLVQDYFLPFENYPIVGRTGWIFVEAIVVFLSGRAAWLEFTETLSPELLSHEELTRDTE